MRFTFGKILLAAPVQLTYRAILYIKKSGKLVIFEKKAPGSFSFSAVLFRNVNTHSRASETAVSKIAKSCAHESSVTAFDIAPAITPATLYPEIILHTAGYTRVLLSSRHFYPRFNARLP